MATANPAMNEAVFHRAGRADMAAPAMTIEGTTFKTAFLMMILSATGIYTYSQATSGASQTNGLLALGFVGGFITALVTIFYPKASPVSAPVYAALEGLVMGGISAMYARLYQGIVFEAVGLSVGVLATMLFLYGTRIIRATEKFKMGVFAATGGICLVYLVSFVLSFFGATVPFIHQPTWVGIGFSLVVVVVAALNLILDFDFIERGVQLQAPKYMEWYGGFSLMVTLVWMYLEILRLLAKMRAGGRD